ncbi:MAG: tol-pal system protein YbgF [Rhodobacteraceae bacterium]|nr:tol-pal system protein YbgF [Paracoccaceae bacterium]
MHRLVKVSATALVLAAALSGAAFGQSKKQTLADIQTDLQTVQAEVNSLKQELAATGATSVQAPASNTAQSRLDAIEAALQSLTGQTEDLQNRINRVVADGTNRIGDLQYRLTEAQGGDPTKLGKTAPLGGATGGTTVAPVAPTQPASNGPELAVSEKSDFDAAKAAYDGGNFRSAADLFATFAQTYTGGPLTGEALFYRGEALTTSGDTANAARAYLDSFSSYPKGPKAPDALTRLGISLGKLGQTQDACTTLGQVSVRYPNAPAIADAAKAMQGLGCQ